MKIIHNTLFAIVFVCALCALAYDAHACEFCDANCPGPGLCFHARGRGWSGCDVACECPEVPQDCFPAGASTTTGLRVCGPTYLVVSVESGSGQANHLPATVGIDVDVLPANVSIRAVLPGSPAFRAGLRPVDRIVTIQGIEARNLSYREIMRALDGTPKVQVTIERSGVTKVFLLSAENLSTVSERIRSSWSPANRLPRQTVATLGGA
jgi:hypothetical protein